MSNEAENKTPLPRAHLTYGDNRQAPESWLVGNREGLQQLKLACEVALEKGQCEDFDLDDFDGLICTEDGWDNGEPGDNSILFSLGCMLAIFVLLGLLAIGIRQVIHWMFA